MKATIEDIKAFIARARDSDDDLIKRIAGFLGDWIEQKRKAGLAGKGRSRRRPNIKAEADLSPAGLWKRKQKEKRGNDK